MCEDNVAYTSCTTSNVVCVRIQWLTHLLVQPAMWSVGGYHGLHISLYNQQCPLFICHRDPNRITWFAINASASDLHNGFPKMHGSNASVK